VRMRDEGAEGKRGPAAPVLAAVIVVAILAPSLLFPFARDQATFAYIGTVIAGGGMPYRDAWDLKPPGIYLAYALLSAAAPSGGFTLMLLVRAADVAIAAVTGSLLVLLARRWHLEGAGVAAAAWYAALYLHSTWWSLAQAEAWANPCVLGAALLILRGSEQPRGRASLLPYLAAGALIGVAALLKFTAPAPVLPFVVLPLFRRDWRALAALTAGVLLPLAAARVWLQAGGAFDAYLDLQAGFLAPYARMNAATVWKRVENVFGYTLPWTGRLLVPMVLAGFALWSTRWGRDGNPGPESRVPSPGSGVPSPGFRVPSPESRTLVTSAFLLGVAAVWAQNKYFGYHWHSALPWLALLSGAGTSAAAEAASHALNARTPSPQGEGGRRKGELTSRRAVWALAAVAPLLWSLAVSWGTYRDAARTAMGQMSREAWGDRFGVRGSGKDYSFPADLEVAAYLREHTSRGDSVQVWGFEPAVYLFSDRRPPGRFFFNVPVVAPFAPESWRSEFMSTLRDSPPRLFLVVRNDSIPWASGRTDDSAAQLQEWPELGTWLAENYRLEKQIEDFSVYRLARR